MIKIKIATDFSNTPGGRYKNDSKYSGEEFRDEFLKPAYEKAKKQNQRIQIDLDGCFGFPSSFIDETFGGLARKTKDKELISMFEFISNDQPGLVKKILDCINSNL